MMSSMATQFLDPSSDYASGNQVTFKECESLMFHARVLLQPKIPHLQLNMELTMGQKVIMPN